MNYIGLHSFPVKLLLWNPRSHLQLTFTQRRAAGFESGRRCRPAVLRQKVGTEEETHSLVTFDLGPSSSRGRLVVHGHHLSQWRLTGGPVTQSSVCLSGLILSLIFFGSPKFTLICTTVELKNMKNWKTYRMYSNLLELIDLLRSHVCSPSFVLP